MAATEHTAEQKLQGRKRPLSFWWYLALTLFIVALGLGGIYGAWYARARAALDKEIAAARARGEPVWFSDLAPAPIDPPQDGTALFLAALDKVQRDDSLMKDFVATFGTLHQVPRDDPAFAAALEQNTGALRLLRQSFEKPYCRLPVDYELRRTRDPAVVAARRNQLTRVALFKVLLNAEVSRSVARSDNERAVGAIEQLLDLGDRLGNYPGLEAQFSRASLYGVGMQATKMVLEYGDLNDEQFERLDRRFQAIERDFRLSAAVLAQRADLMTFLTYWSENRRDPIDPFGIGEGMGRDWGADVLPMRLEAQADALRLISQLAGLIDEPGLDKEAPFDQVVQEMEGSSASIAVFALWMKPVRNQGLEVRQYAVNARLALRVERYHAQHGRLPSSLADVTDEELPSVPIDLYTRAPVGYQPRASGFMIYNPGRTGAVPVPPLADEWHTAIEIVYPTHQPEAPARADGESASAGAPEGSVVPHTNPKR
jgi:hypothetical protein